MCRRSEAAHTERDPLGQVLSALDTLPFPQLLYVSRVIAKLIEERVQEIDRRKYDAA
jgi:hypothetical protein